MAKPKQVNETSYDLTISYDPRVASVHLGAQKYTTPARALAELVANSLDAGASRIEIALEDDELGALHAIEIKDNGSGISPAVIRDRIAVVGVIPTPDIADGIPRMGHFGVGRLAVHRLGAVSTWTTTAEIDHGHKVESRFVLSAERPKSVTVHETKAPSARETGTKIRIDELGQGHGPGLAPARLRDELLSQFCGYLLANPGRQIVVQGEQLDVARLVSEQSEEEVKGLPREVGDVRMRHVVLHQAMDQSRFPKQVIITANGRTVRGLDAECPLSPTYLGIAECPYLERLVTPHRESLIEFDPHFLAIEERVMAAAREFEARLGAQRQSRFIESARQREYYPFKDAPKDSIAVAEQAVYDVVLERIHEHANLDGMSKRQQAVVFRLLRRALDNEDMFAVLSEVASLSDEDVERFRKVLERTTLASLIRLASEVTSRIAFLDFLHELVYGDTAKHVKERSQLHKILEPKCWLFGPRFHLATSDRNFREVIRRHRESAGLAEVPDDVLKLVKGGQDIPDLFLSATKDYPVDPKHHHLLVELKAPRVSIGTKEYQQVRRYAQTILDSAEFDKRSVSWDIFLVSSELTNELELDRHQTGKAVGCVFDVPSLRIWVFQWSEIITAAQEELQLVREHLQKRSQELRMSDYLREEFPEIAALPGMTKQAS